MGLRMKNFNILGIHWKILLLGGGWRGLDKKEGSGVFERGIDTLMHTMAQVKTFSITFCSQDIKVFTSLTIP